MEAILRLQQDDYFKRTEIIVKDGVINAKNQCVTGGQPKRLAATGFRFCRVGRAFPEWFESWQEKPLIHQPPVEYCYWKR